MEKSRFYYRAPFPVRKVITFDGSAGLGAVGAVPLFTVTGEVMVTIIPFCTTLLDEAAPTATLSLGVTGSVALFIAATDAVDIDADEFWVDTDPDPYGIALPATLKDILIAADIIGTVAVQNVTAGVMELLVLWRPISTDGNVVAVA